MRVVWKHPLEHGVNFVSVGTAVRPLFLDAQQNSGMPTMWYEHNVNGPLKNVIEAVFVGTGHAVPADHQSEYSWIYFGSCTYRGGGLVWHGFWRPVVAEE